MRRLVSLSVVLVIPLAWWGAVGSFGCSNSSHGCTPGASVGCACGSAQGEMICQADGQFGTCQCAPTDGGAGDGGVPDGGAPDAGPDGGYLLSDGGVVYGGACCALGRQQCSADGTARIACNDFSAACTSPTQVYGYAFAIERCTCRQSASGAECVADGGAGDAGVPDGGAPDAGPDADGGYQLSDGGVVYGGACCALGSQHCSADGTARIACNNFSAACTSPTQVYGYAFSVEHCTCRQTASGAECVNPCNGQPGAGRVDGGFALSDGGTILLGTCCTAGGAACAPDGTTLIQCRQSISSSCTPFPYGYVWEAVACSQCCVEAADAGSHCQ